MPIRPGQDNDEKREYLYQPLRDDREIRLFKLAPAVSHDAQISVDFVPCSLDSADLPLFETISYVWGGPVDKAEISCEGKRLTIPKNLSDALLYPRNKYRPRILWTDYISINQSDAEEKGVQLGLMATTNRLAARSNIWIGPRLRSTKSAFGLLSKLQKVRKEVFADLRQQHLVAFRNIEQYRRRLPPPNSLDWKALEEMLDMKLLSRAWTVPDIASSRYPVLCCDMYGIIMGRRLLWPRSLCFIQQYQHHQVSWTKDHPPARSFTTLLP